MNDNLLLILYSVLGFQFFLALLSVFFFPREDKYILYWTYLICLFLKTSCFDFLCHYPNFPQKRFIYDYADDTTTILSMLCYSFFFVHIFPYKKFVPGIFKFLSQRLTIILISLLGYWIIFTFKNEQYAEFFIFLIMIFCFIICMFGFFKMISNIRYEWYFFLAGATVMVISTSFSMYYGFVVDKIVGAGYWFRFYAIGTLIDTFLFSSGLVFNAYRMGIRKSELELKVMELENQNLMQRNKILENESSLLRGKITPHFIQNTFDLMGTKIYNADELQCINIINLVSGYLRKVFYNFEKTIITLEDELDFLENYLKMQQELHSFSFTYVIDVGDEVDTYNILVPSMFLQPIVENSIKHGLKKIKQNGEILVIIREENNYCTIQIKDNGPGLIFDNMKERPLSKWVEITRLRLNLLNRELTPRDTLIKLENRKDGISGIEFFMKF